MTVRSAAPHLVRIAILASGLLWPMAAPAQPAAAQAPAGRMIRPNHLIHVVSDVEKSVAFYRDAVGLELMSAPAPLTASALVQRAATISPGATARAATLRIPGSEMSLLLVQFAGIKAGRSPSASTTLGSRASRSR